LKPSFFYNASRYDESNDAATGPNGSVFCIDYKVIQLKNQWR